MSSLVAGHVAYLGSPRSEPFRARSIGLCLVGHHPVLSSGGYSHCTGQNATFTLWSNGPRLHRVNVPVPAHFRTRPSASFDGYLLMNSLVEVNEGNRRGR
jgi:hypothetical protein